MSTIPSFRGGIPARSPAIRHSGAGRVKYPIFEPQACASRREPVIKLYFSIRWKLILSIVLPLILITAVVMGYTLSRIYSYASVNIQAQELSKLQLYADAIATRFDGLGRIAATTASVMGQQSGISPDEMYALLGAVVADNPLVYGAAIAFEPFTWEEDTRLYSPYVYGEDTLQSMDIGADGYDYTDGNWEWYSGPKASGMPLWTEPYFDEGAGNVLMTTYSVPFYRDGNFSGVTTVDVRLDTLNREAAATFTDRHFMILSMAGKFIAQDNVATVGNAGIQDQVPVQNNPAYTQTVNNILAGKSGFDVVNNLFMDGAVMAGESWIFYTPVPATGWNLVSTIPASEATQELRSLMVMGVYGLALMIALAFALTFFVSSRLSRPIKALSNAVGDVARGKLDTTIERIPSMDELGRLSVGFNLMLKNLKKQLEIQSRQTAARQLVEKELQVARETQQALLPHQFPPFPGRKEFELHAVSKPARHVAGDFFDYFFVNRSTLVFVIADVSGKGMAAALVMAVTRTIIRNLARGGKAPAAILAETNELLRESHSGNAFVTVFLGIYNTTNGKIIYANGGHSPPLRISRDGKVAPAGAATGTIVGMLENQQYANAEIRLLSGETLLFYTDGITEARNPDGEFFGEGRVRAYLERHASDSPEVLCNGLEKEICGYQQMNLADDLTILALRRTGTRMGVFFNELIRGKVS